MGRCSINLNQQHLRTSSRRKDWWLFPLPPPFVCYQILNRSSCATWKRRNHFPMHSSWFEQIRKGCHWPTVAVPRHQQRFQCHLWWTVAALQNYIRYNWSGNGNCNRIRGSTLWHQTWNVCKNATLLEWKRTGGLGNQNDLLVNRQTTSWKVPFGANNEVQPPHWSNGNRSEIWGHRPILRQTIHNGLQIVPFLRHWWHPWVWTNHEIRKGDPREKAVLLKKQKQKQKQGLSFPLWSSWWHSRRLYPLLDHVLIVHFLLPMSFEIAIFQRCNPTTPKEKRGIETNHCKNDQLGCLNAWDNQNWTFYVAPTTQ